ncbi:hypothetical protein EMCRGX_G023037, partial [Ephydatia muelleri]
YNRPPAPAMYSFVLCFVGTLLLKIPAARCDCPCEDASLCNPVTAGPRPEVVGFVTSLNNYIFYNWSEITTLALFTGAEYSYPLMCYAHENEARVVLGVSFDVTQLGNATKRQGWVADQLANVQKLFADGINIDIEDPIGKGTAEMKQLVLLVIEAYTAFKMANRNYQVTFDVAWSPDCIDGRCYDAVGLAAAVDFLIVMSYDQRSQIFGDCTASANSALITTEDGIKKYIIEGVPAQSLVLGLPWYGYDYPCLSVSTDDICTIPEVPFRGVNCSDAAGTQVPYSGVCDLLTKSTSGRIWNTSLSSPYFDYVAPGGGVHQVWYDDPDSLTLKYQFANKIGLKGLAFWNVDCLDYSSSGKVRTVAMWKAISAFFDGQN